MCFRLLNPIIMPIPLSTIHAILSINATIAAFLLVICRSICYSGIQRVSVVYILADYLTSKALPNRQGFYAFREEKPMAVSYKKLWKILIDKDIKKKDLSTMAGISPATITKMGKGGHVSTEVLVKICASLDCKVEDIMEIVDAPRTI